MAEDEGVREGVREGDGEFDGVMLLDAVSDAVSDVETVGSGVRLPVGVIGGVPDELGVMDGLRLGDPVDVGVPLGGT